LRGLGVGSGRVTELGISGHRGWGICDTSLGIYQIGMGIHHGLIRHASHGHGSSGPRDGGKSGKFNFPDFLFPPLHDEFPEISRVPLATTCFFRFGVDAPERHGLGGSLGSGSKKMRRPISGRQQRICGGRRVGGVRGAGGGGRGRRRRGNRSIGGRGEGDG